MGNSPSYEVPPLTYGISDVKMIVGPKTQEKIATYWIPYDNADLSVIYQHRHTTDLGPLREKFQEFSRHHKCNVLLWDYPSYGHSTGQFTIKTTCWMASDVYDYYYSIYHKDGQKIVVLGEGWGCGVTAYMATWCTRNSWLIHGVSLRQPHHSFFVNNDESVITSWNELDVSVPVNLSAGDAATTYGLYEKELLNTQSVSDFFTLIRGLEN